MPKRKPRYLVLVTDKQLNWYEIRYPMQIINRVMSKIMDKGYNCSMFKGHLLTTHKQRRHKTIDLTKCGYNVIKWLKKYRKEISYA